MNNVDIVVKHSNSFILYYNPIYTIVVKFINTKLT